MSYILLLSLLLFGKIFNTLMVKYFTGGNLLSSFSMPEYSAKPKFGVFS